MDDCGTHRAGVTSYPSGCWLTRASKRKLMLRSTASAIIYKHTRLAVRVRMDGRTWTVGGNTLIGERVGRGV